MDWLGIVTGGLSDIIGGGGGPIIGDINQPVAGQITVIGDLTKPIGGQITVIGDLTKPIGGQITGDINKPVATQLTGDPTKPIASTIDLLNIPHLTLNDIKDIMTPEVRMHIPNYQQMSFKFLGIELFTWCMSGESEIITQPYIPNRFEECKIECPEEDLRPFPKDTPIHKEK